MPDTWDDEQLLALLKESLRAHLAVPPEFVEAAKNAYAWHNIDAEIAQLTYDSSPRPGEHAKHAIRDRVNPLAHLHLGAHDHRGRGP